MPRGTFEAGIFQAVAPAFYFYARGSIACWKSASKNRVFPHRDRSIERAARARLRRIFPAIFSAALSCDILSRKISTAYSAGQSQFNICARRGKVVHYRARSLRRKDFIYGFVCGRTGAPKPISGYGVLVEACFWQIASVVMGS